MGRLGAIKLALNGCCSRRYFRRFVAGGGIFTHCAGADRLPRAAAIGAAMIVLATLAGIRNTFAGAAPQHGAWSVAAIGSGGAAFGPLVGGILLEHFTGDRCS